MADKQIKTELIEQDRLKIRVTLYYWLKSAPRTGFYLSAVPVTHKDGYESCVLTDIRSIQITQCKRYSKKAEAEALALAPAKQAELIAQNLADWTAG